MIDEKLKPFIIATVRRASYRWHPRYMCKVNARVERGRYRCAKCKEVVGNKDIQIDHIEPVVDPLKGFVGWDEYITRLFCGEEGFQALCKPCHKIKCDEEREIRKATKRAGKVKKPTKRKLRQK